MLRLLGFPLPCPYVIYRRQQVLEHEYLVIDYIGEPDIRMLLETWSHLPHALSISKVVRPLGFLFKLMHVEDGLTVFLHNLALSPRIDRWGEL